MHLCYNEYLLFVICQLLYMYYHYFYPSLVYIFLYVYLLMIYKMQIYTTYIHSPLYFYYCFNPVSGYFYPLPNPSILLLPPSLFISIYFTHHTYYYPNPLPLYIYYYFQRFSCIFIATSHPSIVYSYCYFASLICGFIATSQRMHPSLLYLLILHIVLRTYCYFTSYCVLIVT